MGLAHIISSDWTLVNYFDLRPYWQQFETTKQYAKTLHKMCELSKDSTHCLRTIAHIKHQTFIIEANNQLLRAPTTNRRSKRGALNFVGNIANSLFGVLDAEYAERLTETINNLKQNDDNLAFRIQNATTFIDRTLSIMKKDEESIKTEFNAIGKFLHQTTLNLSRLSQEIHEQEYRIIFNEVAMQAYFHLSNFQQLQEALLDMLTDSHHGTINSDLLSPKELQIQLESILTNSEKTLKLPLPTTEILEYYSFMSISHFVTSTYVIFNIKIPLTTINQYELLKLTAIPWYNGTSFVKIQLSTSHLMVHIHRDQYYALSNTKIQNCICIDGTRFFCRQSHPLYQSGSPVNSCEITLLQLSKTNLKCSVAPTGEGPHWIQLLETNAWIFATKQETGLNVVCNHKLFDQGTSSYHTWTPNVKQNSAFVIHSNF